MFGRKYWGVNRTTFVIDAAGRIAHVFDKVNPLGHGAEVAEVVAALR
jgi:peroxiredoxin Q/BCP